MLKSWKTYETKQNIDTSLDGKLISLNGISDNTYVCLDSADAKILGILENEYNFNSSEMTSYSKNNILQQQSVDNQTEILINNHPCSVISRSSDGELTIILVANPNGSIYSEKYAQDMYVAGLRQA